MEQNKLVDFVLQELVETRQPSVSVRRVLEKKGITYNDDTISFVEGVLKSKSLVLEVDKDSKGYSSFSLTETGQDFLRTFGTYSKFLKGIESENKKIERARKKKPYQTHTSGDGKPPLPFVPEDESFFQRNKMGLLILAIVLILFYIVSRLTESLV